MLTLASLPRLRRHGLAALVTALLAGCAATPPAQRAQVPAEANPASAPVRTVTGFSPGLRCMDDMLFERGTRDVTLMLEELQDSTKRLGIGTRDMMMSSISEMTRRSRAVRLSVFGADSQNLANALQQAQRLTPFQALPEYDIRGSISQLDEDVVRRSGGLGLMSELLFGLRFGSDERLAVLAFDAALARTADFTLVPGVLSKNTVVVARKEANAGDGTARIRKADLTFSFSISHQDGMAQSLRNLVELSAIELVGKLVRLPYWQCLGVPDDAPEIRRELSDWYDSLDEDERIRHFQARMRERHHYDGALDGRHTPAYAAALRSFRSALGLAPEGGDDFALFQAAILRVAAKGPFRPVPAPKTPRSMAPSAAPGETPAPTTSSAPASVFLAAQAPVVEAGQPIRLTAMASAPGYLYCYTADPDTGKLQRIYPNRFQEDPHVEAAQAIVLPGEGAFRLAVGAGRERRFACLHSAREIYADLPASLRWGDFENIGLPSFEAVRDRFAEVSGQAVGFASLGVSGR